MILRQQSHKDVIGKERHLEIDGCTVLPPSLRGIERKELFDGDAVAMGGYTLFMPGHGVGCEPLPLRIARISYEFSSVLWFGCSFAIVT
jgi:hypothetical protein